VKKNNAVIVARLLVMVLPNSWRVSGKL